jgi:cobalamin biosynthesis protein CobW
VTVDGVVAVVDGPAVAAGFFADDPVALAAQRAADPSVEHDNPLEEVFEDQVLCADMILLNKTDLMGPEERERARRTIAEHLPRAVKIVETSQGGIDPALILGLDAAAESDLAARPSHHDAEGEHDHDDFESISLPVGPVASPESLAARVGRAAGAAGVLRIKGFVSVEGRPMRLVVQGVGQRITHHFDRPWNPGEERGGRLVVIGLKGFDRPAVEAALAG